VKKNRICKVVLLSILVFFLKSYAHPPTKIDMDFSNDDKILKVEIHHPVLFIRNHYINKI